MRSSRRKCFRRTATINAERRTALSQGRLGCCRRRTKRKTPALVAYVRGDRLLGEEAAAVAARVPDLALGQLRDFLGVPADSPAVAALLAEHHLPWKVVPAKGRGTVAFQMGAGDPVTIEEAVVCCSPTYRPLSDSAATLQPESRLMYVCPHQRHQPPVPTLAAFDGRYSGLQAMRN